LKLALRHHDGTISGSFRRIGKPAGMVKVSGVIQTKMNIGAGVFLGPTQSGNFTLIPE
jgi:hypothetical protein